MKASYGWVILIFVILLSAAGCKDTEQGVENPNPDNAFPVMEHVQSVKVMNNNGSEVIFELNEEEDIVALLQGLQDAVPSYIDDPEPNGRLYKVEMKNELTTQTYTVNDLRETDSLDFSVKIYTESSEGQGQAWELSSAWIRLLLGYTSAIVEPLLYVSTNEDSSSVIVQSTLSLDRGSVEKAIKDTLITSVAVSGGQPQYHIYWSDSQRFVVRFPNLEEGTSVHFRLDGVLSETGVSFASESQPIRNLAVLNSQKPLKGLKWVNINSEIIREQKLESAVLIQPIWTDNQDKDSILVYHPDDSQSLIQLSTGDLKSINIREWPDLEEVYGNDYGTNVLFSDRFVEEKSYAVKGNRTVYSVNRKTGEAKKLYSSEKPIYGMASSPDSNRIAILVSSESFIGPFADLIVINKEGKEIFRKKEASYVGHSDGFLFVYPMTWVDDQTIGVPYRWKDEDRYVSGNSYIHIKDASIKNEEEVTLPNEAIELLEQYTGGPGSVEIIRVLPSPKGDQGRYYAVQISNTGCWLIDVISKKVTWLGPGTLVQWNELGEVVVWQSKQEGSIHIIGL
ncbi:hypothetical protein [Paenibacillus eucommiae]|uniref:Lipoprotein LpqB beta-propeller domain-containing protein n=1 Tax=Paenibacillus eucommiae TaxID=1355755 RepID=A0ABS4J397_9BACL|nr:hypothetical protein [Paenibacillus eucommiae]MBP1993760.1 hypothetical protein [Paenibacillus eucommiae]